MAYIESFGAYLPETIVTNEQLAARLGCDAEWIFTASGILERRQAAAESVADLAMAAGQECLRRAELLPEQIGMVIVASGTGERRFPGPAAEVAKQLRITPGAPALDVPMASAGTLFAMTLASQAAARAGRVLVIGAEKMTAVAWREPADPNLAILFGDGAGACVISDRQGIAEIIDFALSSDGSFAHDLRLEHDGTLAMEGRSVILQASRKIPSAILLLLERNGWAASGVDALLMHQANQNLMNRVAQSVGIAPERVVSVIEKTGNTSSASMLIAAAEWAARGEPLAGKRIAFAAFGAGFHWGALLARGC